jgi:hypothetical protein
MRVATVQMDRSIEDDVALCVSVYRGVEGVKTRAAEATRAGVRTEVERREWEGQEELSKLVGAETKLSFWADFGFIGLMSPNFYRVEREARPAPTQYPCEPTAESLRAKKKKAVGIPLPPFRGIVRRLTHTAGRRAALPHGPPSRSPGRHHVPAL